MLRDPNCPRCGGTGHLIVDAMTTRRCECLKRAEFHRLVGPDIFNARRIRSELGTCADGNVALVGALADAFPHLLFGLAGAYALGRSFRLVTDSEVNTAKFSRDDDGDGLELFVMPDLIVLYISGARHLQNAASELLAMRRVHGRPTWLVSQYDPRTGAEDLAREADGYKRVLAVQTAAQAPSPPVEEHPTPPSAALDINAVIRSMRSSR